MGGSGKFPQISSGRHRVYDTTFIYVHKKKQLFLDNFGTERKYYGAIGKQLRNYWYYYTLCDMGQVIKKKKRNKFLLTFHYLSKNKKFFKIFLAKLAQ